LRIPLLCGIDGSMLILNRAVDCQSEDHGEYCKVFPHNQSILKEPSGYAPCQSASKRTIRWLAGRTVLVIDFAEQMELRPKVGPVRSHVTGARLFYLLLLFIPAACYATLIITVWSPTKILIGADGLLVHPDLREPYQRGCKIRQATSDCFFSIAGVQDDRSSGYDLVPLAAKACQGNGSIMQRAEDFKSAALPEVRREWISIKRHNPKSYALSTQYGPAHLAVVFFGGRPLSLVIVQFVEDSKGQMVPDESVVRSQAFGMRTERDEVGEYLNIDAYRKMHPEVDRLDDVFWVPTLISKAIDLEESEKIKRIGAPIAVLEITSAGPRWVEQGDCQSIGNYVSSTPQRVRTKIAAHKK
jgi:hypothetical protein